MISYSASIKSKTLGDFFENEEDSDDEYTQNDFMNDSKRGGCV